MAEQDKDDRGRFARKSDTDRTVRSIRATDKTWNILGDKAEEHDMTRADYLEALVNDEVQWEDEESTDLDFDLDEVAEILKEALTFRANAGGKIKAKIKEALVIMDIDLDEE
jgi:hypothetical protein